MKKILFIILFSPVCLVGQVKQQYSQYGSKWKRMQVDSAFRLPMLPISTKDFFAAAPDSGQLYYSPSDSTIKWHTGFQWRSAGAGGGGTDNMNLGSGYRLLVPSSQGIKTLFSDLTLTLDSTSNSNGITIKVDTAQIATQFDIAWLVPTSRSINTNLPIRGGGNLGADRTLSIDTSVANVPSLTTNSRLQKIIDSLNNGGSIYGIDDVLAVGQSLTTGRTITTGTNLLTVTGSSSGASNYVTDIINSNTGSALHTQSINGNAINGISTAWEAADFQINPSSTNTTATILRLSRASSGTPGDNIAGAIDFYVDISTGNLSRSHQLISRWATVNSGTRKSELDIIGNKNAFDFIQMNIQNDGIVRVNDNADTLATKAYARSVAGGGGYTNLTQFVDQGNWKVFYSNGSGDVTELALGASGTVLTSNGASSAPTFETPAGGGITTLNTLTGATQTFATGTSGSNFNISSSGTTHTFNLPDADRTVRGVMTTQLQEMNGQKVFVDGIYTGNASNISGFGGNTNDGISMSLETYIAGQSNHGNVSHFVTTKNRTVTADYNHYSFIVENKVSSSGLLTEASSGTHNLVAALVIKPLTLDNGTATTTNSASLYIQGSTVGTASITNNYSMWIDSGAVRMDGVIYVEEQAAPGTPPSTLGALYEKTDGKIYFKNDAGTEYDLTATGGGGGALNDLTDVVITAAATGEYLRYDGANWVDATIQAGDIPDLSATYVPVAGTTSITGKKTFTGGFATTSYNVITGGSSSTIGDNITTVIFDPASDLSAYTLTMPASPADGQWIYISTGSTIAASAAVSTSFTLSPNAGQSIYGAVTMTQLLGGDEAAFQYKASNTTWYRKK